MRVRSCPILWLTVPEDVRVREIGRVVPPQAALVAYRALSFNPRAGYWRDLEFETFMESEGWASPDLPSHTAGLAP
jgi:hypothetical protein